MKKLCKTHVQEIHVSGGICGITFGHGKLDHNGHWEVNCDEEELNYYRREFHEVEAAVVMAHNDFKDLRVDIRTIKNAGVVSRQSKEGKSSPYLYNIGFHDACEHFWKELDRLLEETKDA